MSNALHILLIDDQKEVRSALRLRLLGLFPAAHITECGLLSEVARLPLAHPPGFILLDGDLPGLRRDLSAGLQRLRACFPGAVILVMRSDPAGEADALRAGADGFLCKSDPPETFAARIRQSLPG